MSPAVPSLDASATMALERLAAARAVQAAWVASQVAAGDRFTAEIGGLGQVTAVFAGGTR